MQEVFALINEMSPYLLLGFLLAGLMHAFIPGMVYSRYLSGHGFRSVLYGALFGIPLPLCSCGVIPTAMSLRKEGASKGATVSFLIATPETGVDSIIATYSLLGLPFALIRPIAACCNALMGGLMVNAFADEKEGQEVSEEDTKSCCCHHEHHEGQRSNWKKGERKWKGSERGVKEGSENGVKGEWSMVNGQPPHTPPKGEITPPWEGTGEVQWSMVNKLKEALQFGFIEMMEDIGKWLVIGLIIAGLITVFVPDSLFTIFRGNTLMSMLLVLCIAIPMYICATGSIPIAVALMLKGLTPGAALVLLMAGPACNMASILVINKVLGKKTLLVYLISIITMAICWGCIVDYCLPQEWFMTGMMSKACHEADGTSWFNIGCTILLALLLLNVLRLHFSHKHEEGHCCCHEHKHEGVKEE